MWAAREFTLYVDKKQLSLLKKNISPLSRLKRDERESVLSLSADLDYLCYYDDDLRVIVQRKIIMGAIVQPSIM